jgi:GNAT superfamily N-acetyltransferase
VVTTASAIIAADDRDGAGPSGRLTIRECLEADVPQVLDLMALWSAERITYGYVPSPKARLIAALGPCFLVATMSARVMGFVLAHELVSEGTAIIAAGEPCIEIDDLYVAPELRGAGIGSALLERLLSAGRQRGTRHVLLYSSAKDLDPVLRFYRRHGFDTWFVEMYRDLSAQDAVTGVPSQTGDTRCVHG